MRTINTERDFRVGDRYLGGEIVQIHPETECDLMLDIKYGTCQRKVAIRRGTVTGTPTNGTIRERLEYLRGELRAERISYLELTELQALAEHIEPGDVELLEAAGVPEYGEDHATE